MESFPSCGNNLCFLWKLRGAFLGFSSTADVTWMAYAPRGAHALDPMERSRRQEAVAGRRAKQDRLPKGNALFIPPQMVFVQLSRTVVQVQIWEL